MEYLRRFPVWVWVILLLLVGLLVILIFVFPFWSHAPTIPSGLVEKRLEVGSILQRSADADDIDIRVIVELENEKKYAEAVNLMERAITANTIKKDLNSSLVSAASELSRLATQVRPTDLAKKAIEAFALLEQFADADKQYYRDRETLYKMTKDYYAALLAKQNPPIPETLRDVVDAVNNDLKKANELNAQFAAAIGAFDALAVGK